MKQCVYVENEAGMLNGKKATTVRIFGCWGRNCTLLWDNYRNACVSWKSLWSCSLKCISTRTEFHIFYITFQVKIKFKEQRLIFLLLHFFKHAYMKPSPHSITEMNCGNV
jgi:hypothetical protein